MRTVFCDFSDEVQQHRSDELEMLLITTQQLHNQKKALLGIGLRFTFIQNAVDGTYAYILQNVEVRPRGISLKTMKPC